MQYSSEPSCSRERKRYRDRDRTNREKGRQKEKRSIDSPREGQYERRRMTDLKSFSINSTEGQRWKRKKVLEKETKIRN